MERFLTAPAASFLLEDDHGIALGVGVVTLGPGANVGPSCRMTATISSKGQMVIPRQVRERLEIRPGDDFLLLELSNGDLLLRRSRPPRRSLAWHMRRMRGVGLERNLDPVRRGRLRRQDPRFH